MGLLIMIDDLIYFQNRKLSFSKNINFGYYYIKFLNTIRVLFTLFNTKYAKQMIKLHYKRISEDNAVK